MEWQRNIVSTSICEHCFSPDCGGGQYVHISSLRSFVVWTHPRKVGLAYDPDSTMRAMILDQFGSVGFPDEAWGAFRDRDRRVPPPEFFPQTDGYCLLDAWLPPWAHAAQPGAAVADTEPFMAKLTQTLVGSDTLNREDALCCVARWIAWMQEHAKRPVQGQIADATTRGAQTETLWTTGSSEQDWIGLATWRETIVPAMGQHHVFIPDEMLS